MATGTTPQHHLPPEDEPATIDQDPTAVTAASTGHGPTAVSPATARPDGAIESPIDEGEPEFVTDETIEFILRGAKALVVVVYAVVIMTFVMLALGFFLHLAGASPEATFVDWVYRNTGRAMEPFRGMFPVRPIDDRSVFDASLLFAAALYGFVAIGLHAIVVYLSEKARRVRPRRHVR